MSLLKYIERLKRMDDLIRRKATGSPEEFASRLGISRSMLMNEMNDLKELGAQIEYCQLNKSYFYSSGFSLTIGNNIRGGLAQFPIPIQSYWTVFFEF